MQSEIKLSELQEEYLVDIKWEFSKVEKYLQLLPSTIAKYQNIWLRYKKQLDKTEIEFDDLWISRFTYYKNDFDIKLSNSEIKDFINKDVELNNIRKKQKYLITAIEFVEKCMKNLDSIRWDIKNVIEYNKFINGE